VLGARAILALLDPDADPEDRFDGAMLVWNAINDLHALRRLLVASND
jgi:hypothetical protein